MAQTSDSIPGNIREPATAVRGNGATGGSRHAAVSAWQARWNSFAPRERRMVGLAALVLGSFLVFVVAIRPAWTTVRDAPARLGELDAQFQQMQRMVGESKELRGTPRMAPAQAGVALKSATDAMGSVGRLNVVGDRATLTVTNATGDQLRRWLVDARTTARSRPVEATLSRSGSGYSGSVIVALPAP